MKRVHPLPIAFAALVCVLGLLGCSREPGVEGSEKASTTKEEGMDPVAAMNAGIQELMARPEKDAQVVEVQHLLVGFLGAPGLQDVTRSKAEAEALAAELVQRIERGEDFDKLIEEHTDDSPPGIYMMSLAPRPDAFPRRQMMAAFGDVGWRLEVGEFGVAPYHPEKSAYGWHIIKRLR